MTTETEATEQSIETPNTDIEKVRTLMREDAETYDLVMDGPVGYASEVEDRIAIRWGQEAVPTTNNIYQAAYQIRQNQNVERPEEEEEETITPEQFEERSNPGEVAELSAAATPSTPTLDEPVDSEGRASNVILSSDELLLQAAEEVTEEFIEDVKDAVVEEYGRFYEPTEGSVRKAVSSLRSQDTLPDFSDGFEETGEPAQIVYICGLCGHREQSYKRIKEHISCEDDAVHADRTANETHLIQVEGREIEDTHEAFGSDEMREEFDDGFDVLWTLYQNPDARQGDIANLLDVSVPTLRDRLDTLGIEWGEREEQVEEIVEGFWENGDDEEEQEETVTVEYGNTSYTGPEKGADTTSGRPGQNIADRPAAQENALEETTEDAAEVVTIEFTERDLRDLLTGRDPAPAKEQILHALMDR